MSRAYEFLKDRMETMDPDIFDRYFRTVRSYKFFPPAAAIPKLKRSIAKERNDIARSIMEKPVIYVEVTQTDKKNVFRLCWEIGFEGMETKIESLAVEEELYGASEIDNMVKWLTHMNGQELEWETAVDMLHGICGN